ncbi:cytochrome c-type biogenesis protein [Hydrogenophaga sp. RWCD_12]|uniref:cytochrome c-type biogenesis protein n=1 Tax=Hydrogenophaga sp. RWCD_12 TaxID=3391190 RepID=UPI0039855079
MTLQRWLRPWLIATLMAVSASTAIAAEALPAAADPALEERVNHLAAELRCLVCQNQSLADSHAELAIDLKNQVREQLRAGRSEQDVINYMTERYGDFVLYRPPLKATTVLLWGGPLLLLLLGAIVLWRHLGRGAVRETDAPLDAEAAQRAAALLDDAPSPARDA